MCLELNPLDAGYDEYFNDQREALPGACIDFIERKRDRPFFAVASFINPHDICFAYSAYKGKSVKGKQSVDHLYKLASDMPPEQLPPLPDNFRIPELEPKAIELHSKANAVTPSGTMRKVYDERQWQIYRNLKQWIKSSDDQDAESFALAPDPSGMDCHESSNSGRPSRQCPSSPSSRCWRAWERLACVGSIG